jgi:hypothetical protein
MLKQVVHIVTVVLEMVNVNPLRYLTVLLLILFFLSPVTVTILHLFITERDEMY